MNHPPYLKPGDTIAIVSTARKILHKEIINAERILNSWGFEVLLGKHIYAEDHQFAGTVEQRTTDFQQMINDSNVKAVFCSRGGYGSVQILDHLDFANFQSSPKWIVGYSDITAIHSFIHQQFFIPSIHATMPINFPDPDEESPSLSSLRSVITGKTINYQFKAHHLNRTGKTKGLVIGGNLSVLFSLLSSNADIDTQGKILFIEDLDEYLYHIHRMLINFKRSGKLKNLRGLVVGGLSDMNDNSVPFGKTAEEIVHEMVVEYNYPVCFDFPAGHIDQNMAFKLGVEAELIVADNEVEFIQY